MDLQNYFLPIALAAALVAIPLFGLWLWALVHCAHAEFKQPVDKIAWILILIFLGPLGTLLYLVSGRRGTVAPRESDKWVV